MKIEQCINYYESLYKTLVSLRDEFGLRVTSKHHEVLLLEHSFLPNDIRTDSGPLFNEKLPNLINKNYPIFKNSYKEAYFQTVQSLEKRIEHYLISNKRVKEGKLARLSFDDYNPYTDLCLKITEIEYLNEVLKSQGEHCKNLENVLKEKEKEIKNFRKIAYSKPFRTLLFKDYLILKKYDPIENFLKVLLRDVNLIKKNFNKWQIYLEFPAIFIFYNYVELGSKEEKKE